MTWGVLALVALASYRLTHLVTSDSITEPWRQRLVERYPAHVEPIIDPTGHPVPNSARQVPHPVTVFVLCNWCVSFWTSLALVLVAHFVGLLGSWQLAGFGWLAASTVVGLLSRLEA